MQQIEAKPTWHTQNTSLATALYTAGVKLADPQKPCVNIYDYDTIKSSGKIRPGETIFEAVSRLVNQGIPGEVSYIFERDPRIDDLTKAFDEMAAAIKAAEQGGKDQTADIPDVSDEQMMRIACQVLKNRKAFANAWKAVTPLIRFSNSGKEVKSRGKDGKQVIKLPGFKIVSLNAADETIKHLKLI